MRREHSLFIGVLEVLAQQNFKIFSKIHIEGAIQLAPQCDKSAMNTTPGDRTIIEVEMDAQNW